LYAVTFLLLEAVKVETNRRSRNGKQNTMSRRKSKKKPSSSQSEKKVSYPVIIRFGLPFSWNWEWLFEPIPNSSSGLEAISEHLKKASDSLYSTWRKYSANLTGPLGKYLLHDTPFAVTLLSKVADSSFRLKRLMSNLSPEEPVILKQKGGNLATRFPFGDTYTKESIANILTTSAPETYFHFTVLAEIVLATPGRKSGKEMTFVYYEFDGTEDRNRPADETSWLFFDNSENISSLLKTAVLGVNLKGFVTYMLYEHSGKYLLVPIVLSKRIAPGYECFLPYLEMFSTLSFPNSPLHDVVRSYTPPRKMEKSWGSEDEEIREFLELFEKLPVAYGGPRLYGKNQHEEFIYGTGFFPLFQRGSVLEPSGEIFDFNGAFEKWLSVFTDGITRSGMLPFPESFTDGLLYDREAPEVTKKLLKWYASSPWKSFFPFYFVKDGELFFSAYNPFFKDFKKNAPSKLRDENFLSSKIDECLGKKTKDTLLNGLLGELKNIYFLDRDEEGNLYVNNSFYKLCECALKAVDNPVSRNLPVLCDSALGGLKELSEIGVSEKSFRFYHEAGLMEFFMRGSAELLGLKFQPELTARMVQDVSKGVSFKDAVRHLEAGRNESLEAPESVENESVEQEVSF